MFLVNQKSFVGLNAPLSGEASDKKGNDRLSNPTIGLLVTEPDAEERVIALETIDNLSPAQQRALSKLLPKGVFTN